MKVEGKTYLGIEFANEQAMTARSQ